MNTAATVVVAVLAASAAATGISLSLRSSSSPSAPPQLGELQASLRDLQAENQRLARELAALANQPQPAVVPLTERTVAPVLGPEQVAAAVEAYLRQREGSVAEASGAGGDGGKPNFDLDKDFAGLVGTNFWSNGASWKRAFAAGRMDDVVAQFEALAKASPNDVGAQMNLANAYLAYLQMDNSKWQLSAKADKQFDKVLDIDDHHWEARFSKAVSYTFWPDFLGKKPEAIQHFETLVKQQENMPVQDDQAQTYLFLGNLLAERDPERARQVWQQGATRHPNNQELRQKLAR